MDATSPAAADPPSLRPEERIAALMLRDRTRLEGRLRKAGAAELEKELRAAEERVARRRERLPRPTYPDELPITARKDDILAALRDHQVVVVAGETGSGKSTQLPMMCLELGRGVLGLVGHTQPRRIAARSVAERVAEELGSTIGDAVGYTYRFTDRSGDNTFVKVMTDGILLAEIQRDRLLTRYDTLIIDEAHERSLNVDFILGYLKQLLPRRPDLKVVVTSATIDTARFSEHFGGAPVVEVSGRTYPVEVRYRPLVDEDGDDTTTGDRDQIQGITDAVHELSAAGPGDVLVFLSGEREIRDTADALSKLDLRDTEILPLYARLSSAEQHRVFEAHRGRRIVLATNVAETSLTVPGIRYVVDPGTARISRFNRRTKVQRLPIEAVSQASANQRAGRCGRVAPGICIRLYSEDDFASRPEFTEPEILRTNLASVILQMAAIGLGDIARFPFVEAPDARAIKDGVALLEELGALAPGDGDPGSRLTPLGRTLARLPVDPRLARMVVESGRQGCVREVTIIAAALSIQDPRERPQDKQEHAAQLHARFKEEGSDFLAYLRLWEYLQEQQADLSSSAFRRLCKAEHLHYLRVREWQDLTSQLRQVAATLKLPLNHDPAEPDRVHLALLSGLLSHIGTKAQDSFEYQGARNARFAIAPGSVLFKKAPRWVMAAELVETNRMWGRVVARINPEWAERVGEHLVKRAYSDPLWDPERGVATVAERVSLFGLPLVAGRRIAHVRIDPAGAREVFLRNALVEGDWRSRHDFLNRNAALVEQVRALEDRVRRRDLLVVDDELVRFFDERVAPSVATGRAFDRWWTRRRAEDPHLLDYTLDVLVDPAAGAVDPARFPDEWRQDDMTLPLTYRYDPAGDDPDDVDGVTVHVPLAVLNELRPDGFDWHIPGLRHELVTELIRSLPKPQRRLYVPAPDHATAVLEQSSPADGPLLPVVADRLGRITGDPLSPNAFDLDALPRHLRIRFSVEDDAGRVVAAGRDLAALRQQLKPKVRRAVATAAPASVERRGAREWTFGTIDRVVETVRSGHTVRAYPALVDEGDTVGVRLLPSRAEQADVMWTGNRRLLRLTIPSPKRFGERLLGNATKLALADSPYANVGELLDDCIDAAVDELLTAQGGPVWDEESFEKLRVAVAGDLVGVTERVVRTAAAIVDAAHAIKGRLRTMTAPALDPVVDDVHAQLTSLVGTRFVSRTGTERLPDVLRYVDGIDRRLDKVKAEPHRDADRMRRVQRLEDEFLDVVDARGGTPPQGADEVRWMLEELRISFFAQTLRTRGPISEERVRSALARLRTAPS